LDGDCKVESVFVFTLTNIGSTPMQVDSAEGILDGTDFDFTSSFHNYNPIAPWTSASVNYPIEIDYCTGNTVEMTAFVTAASAPALGAGVCEAFSQLSFQTFNITPNAGTLPTTTTPPTTVSANGDPHIHRWNDERYSFQGECDLVLVQAPSDSFHGDGCDIHLRTT
jgi:hypothetical protein